MPSTEKRAYANCPKCGQKPSEFKGLADKRMRWECHHCGAHGEITPESTEAPAPAVKPHWSQR